MKAWDSRVLCPEVNTFVDRKALQDVNILKHCTYFPRYKALRPKQDLKYQPQFRRSGLKHDVTWSPTTLGFNLKLRVKKHYRIGVSGNP